MRLRAALVGTLLLSLLPACGSRTDAIEAEKQKWRREGWEFVEIVGKPTANPEYILHCSSRTARSVTAFATAAPEPIRKEYDQDKDHAIYLIVTMGSDPMHTFSLVFSKPRPAPAPPAAPPR